MVVVTPNQSRQPSDDRELAGHCFAGSPRRNLGVRQQASEVALGEASKMYRSEIAGAQDEEPQNKANSRDAIGVSIVHGGRMVGSFVGRQQLAEWAPLIRMPFCG